MDSAPPFALLADSGPPAGISLYPALPPFFPEAMTLFSSNLNNSSTAQQPAAVFPTVLSVQPVRVQPAVASIGAGLPFHLNSTESNPLSQSLAPTILPQPIPSTVARSTAMTILPFIENLAMMEPAASGNTEAATSTEPIKQSIELLSVEDIVLNLASSSAAVPVPAPMFVRSVNNPLRKLSYDLIKTYKQINEVCETENGDAPREKEYH